MAFWQRLREREALAAWSGLVALALLLACGLAMALDARAFQGASAWAKPAKFAASFVVWFWTLAWLWPALGRGWEARVARRCCG
jgi:hypothetical protein